MSSNSDGVPSSLRIWFVIHFVVDVVFAVPLFFAPVPFLGLLGWTEVDPVSTRLVAAGLFGIGIQSLIGRNETPEAFKAMLNLKIIWSTSAVAGFAWSLAQGAPPMTFGLLAIFAVFSAVWWTYRIGLSKGGAKVRS